jgi:hypothetical protein
MGIFLMNPEQLVSYHMQQAWSVDDQSLYFRNWIAKTGI